MTTKKLLKLEGIVKPILEESFLARNDDFYLYGQVIAALCPECEEIPLYSALIDHLHYGLPNIKSVERVRRKLQAKYPELESERAKQRRAKEESAYVEYAKIG